MTNSSRPQAFKDHFTKPSAGSRPILTYINGDTCWLVSFPRPKSERSIKAYYHLVIDPWFGTPAIAISAWLVDMKLGRPAGIKSRAELDAAILEIEAAAGHTITPSTEAPAVDAICITGKVGDHCNVGTLEQFESTTPVYVIPIGGACGAGPIVTEMNHFTTILDMQKIDTSKTSWKIAHPGGPMPSWLTLFCPQEVKFNNFGVAIVTTANESALPEWIVATPHGIHAPSLHALATDPELRMLAILAPMKENYTFGMLQVLGCDEVLRVTTRTAEQPYYIRSADVVPLGITGFFSWFSSQVSRDLQWGLDQLKQRGEVPADKPVNLPQIIEVENGGSFVLE